MKPSLAALLLVSALFPAAALAEQEPQYSDEQNWVIAIGSEIPQSELDSATADADAEGTDNPLLELAAKHKIAEPDWLKERIAAQGSGTVLAALGDSVTAAYTTCKFPFCPANSWSSGVLPTSVRTELSDASGRAVNSFLVAVPAAVMAHMPAQAYAVFLASSYGLKVERMTLFIGHNDPGVCGGPKDGETKAFADKYASTLKILGHVASRRRARLFVSSIVEVPTLARYGDVIPAGGDKTCRQLWTRVGRCAPLLGAGASPDAGAKISAQIAAYDDVLARLAEGKDWVLYADIFNANSREGLQDPSSWLSPADCFHPSVIGQGVLGQIAWEGYGATPGIASFFAFPAADEPVARPAPVLSEGTAAELDAWRSESKRP
jgi:lysophospholipase L1-like esterase